MRRLRCFRRAPAQLPSDWRTVVDGVELATLHKPQFHEMFWTSFEIVASTTPADPRLREDAFWLSDAWRLVDAATGRTASMAFASSAGLREGGRRVVLRGLYPD